MGGARACLSVLSCLAWRARVGCFENDIESGRLAQVQPLVFHRAQWALAFTQVRELRLGPQVSGPPPYSHSPECGAPLTAEWAGEHGLGLILAGWFEGPPSRSLDEALWQDRAGQMGQVVGGLGLGRNDAERVCFGIPIQHTLALSP